MKILDYICLVLRLLVGALFIVSGFMKLVQPIEYFEYAIGFYRIVPDAAVPFTALAIAWTELIAGTFLFLGYLYKPSTALVLALNTLFQTALAQAIFRKLPIQDCGCFGGLISLSPCQTYVLDSVLLLLMIGLLAVKKSLFSLDQSAYLR